MSLFQTSIETGFDVIASVDVEQKVLHFIGVTADDGPHRTLALMEGTPEGEDPVPKGYTAGKLFCVIRYPMMTVDKSWCSDNFYKAVIAGPGIGQVLAIPADRKFEIHNFLITFKKVIRYCHH